MESRAPFSQVLFNDIPQTYRPSTSVTCHYTLPLGFQPTKRDWVGIFKVGWTTTRDYFNFVWVEPPVDLVEHEPVRKQILFCEYYLPKEDSEFYQFCYVDSTGHVRGASTPFSFKSSAQSVECSLENDLIVITTQDEVDRNVQEKVELSKELEQMRAEARTAQIALMEEKQEVERLREKNEESAKKEAELVEELNQARKQNESLALSVKEKEHEAKRLQEEILIQMENHLELDHQNAREKGKLESNILSVKVLQEKYDQAVITIDKLKAESEEHRGRVNVKHAELAELKPKVRSKEQELLNLKDRIQLFEVDLQYSEKEKQKLSAELSKLHGLKPELERLQAENRELRKRLSQQEAWQIVPDDDYKVQCHTILGQLEDAMTQLVKERKLSNDRKWQAEDAERKLLDIKERLDNAGTLQDQSQHKSGQLELRLTEALDIIAEKDAEIAEMNGIFEERGKRLTIEKKEKEELARENQTLMRDIQGMRRELADLQAAANVCSSPIEPATQNASGATHKLETLPETFNYENFEQTMGRGPNTEEKPLVCQHCHESFPGITQEELDLHELSHRVCPFCTLICDHMEQSLFEDHVYGHEI